MPRTAIGHNTRPAVHRTRASAKSAADDTIDKVLPPIDNPRDQIRHRSIHQMCLPVGSRAIEVTCENLVALRIKRNGHGWSDSRAKAIFNLRSLAVRDRWEEAMEHLMSNHRRQVGPIGVHLRCLVGDLHPLPPPTFWKLGQSNQWLAPNRLRFGILFRI